MDRAETAVLTVLCLIEDGDRLLLQSRTKRTGRDMPCREVTSNGANRL